MDSSEATCEIKNTTHQPGQSCPAKIKSLKQGALTITQLRIIISAKVIPLDSRTKALRVSAWPMKDTNTVTNDISIVLEIRAVNREAVDGAIHPVLEINHPHLGCLMEMMSHAPLHRVEYTDSARMVIDSRLNLVLLWISLLE